MRRLSRAFVFVLVAACIVAARPAAAVTYLLEVQSGGPGTVDPPGPIEVPAGGSQTFTFTPSACSHVGDVTVDDAVVGNALTSYTFTNVQSDHLLYVAFYAGGSSTALEVRPPVGTCDVPDTLVATVTNGFGGQVQFYRNGALLGAPQTVTGGVATYVLASGLPTGSYTFSARYSGTGCADASDSPVIAYDVALCPTRPPTGATPRRLAIGDLDGDGHPDIVTANGLGASVSVLLAYGDGTFRPRTDYDVPPYPAAVAIDDFNGDGRPDVVAACKGDLTTLLGQGNGTLGTRIDNPLSANFVGYPQVVAVGDLNADGKLDLAASSFGSAKVYVFIGNGDGSFAATAAYATGVSPTGVAIADLNRDGNLDLAVSDGDVYSTPDPYHSYIGGGITVLLGGGDGTFTILPSTHTLGQHPYSVAIGDLNGDGWLDLVAADHGVDFPATAVSVILGYPGAATFDPAQSAAISGSSPIRAVISDFDRDGVPDIVEANDDGHGFGGTHRSRVSVLRGMGNGTFEPPVAYLGSGDYSDLAVADLNADGGPDVVVTDWYANIVKVLLNPNPPQVATLMARFDAAPGTGGIELRWSFGNASRVSAVTLERGPDAAGPWSAITPERIADGDVTTAVDRTAGPGTTYFYRLVVTLAGGSTVTFGPIASSASASIGETALNLVAPNPARSASHIEYTVARAGRVRLEVADVAGRIVATLFDGVQRPGRFQVAWDGTSRGMELPAGLYFVRLTAPDRVLSRTLARIR